MYATLNVFYWEGFYIDKILWIEVLFEREGRHCGENKEDLGSARQVLNCLQNCLPSFRPVCRGYGCEINSLDLHFFT